MTRARIPELILEEAMPHSFRDFHAKGVDYLCLRRSPKETVKLYFFDGDARALPEVVAPHDHRYNFETTILCGASQNVLYERSDAPDAKAFYRFLYWTRLNGGTGFKWVDVERLREVSRETYTQGSSYSMMANQFHTIRIVENETVLLSRQFENVVRLHDPTTTYFRGDPPALDGLYRRWTADAILARVAWLETKGVHLGGGP